jgi:hypothetical protein
MHRVPCSPTITLPAPSNFRQLIHTQGQTDNLGHFPRRLAVALAFSILYGVRLLSACIRVTSVCVCLEQPLIRVNRRVTSICLFLWTYVCTLNTVFYLLLYVLFGFFSRQEHYEKQRMIRFKPIIVTCCLLPCHFQ